MLAKDKLIFAIDFDGTIVKHEWPFIGPLLPWARETINDLYAAGHKIIIWTCRTSQQIDLPGAESTIFDVERFLRKNRINFDTINNNIPDHGFQSAPKVYADIYIDDKNFGGFPGWQVIYKAFLNDKYLQEPRL